MITIQIDGADALVADFADAPPRVHRAAVRALNRAMTTGRAFAARSIAAAAGLKVGTVRERLPIREATKDRPEARMSGKLTRIPLMAFKATGPRPSRGRGAGVKTRVPAAAGKYKNRYPHAFITTVTRAGRDGIHDGHEGVFVRVGSSTHKSAGAWSANLPIKQLYGPSLGHLLRKIRPEAIATTQAAFEKNFAHEFQFEMSRRAGGAAPAGA